LLLTDNFTVTTNVELQPNFEIANRQTGLQALSLYTISNNGTNSGHGVQLGNTSTNVGQPGFPSNGNFLLLADDYGVQNNLVFNNALLGGAPLNFTFDLYAVSQSVDLTKWGAFSLRSAGNAFVVAGAGEFGMLRRANGGMQFFTNGAAFATLDNVAPSSLFSVTFSDLAGTGSPFAGNGSRVVVLNNGVQVLDYNFGGGNLSASGLKAGFYGQNGAVSGVDNLAITTTAVPEPSSVGIFMAGALVFILVVRRARRTA
jgi:hypothetical protein